MPERVQMAQGAADIGSGVAKLLEEKRRLVEALREIVDTMEMQEKRMDGTFHVDALTALVIWDASKAKARALLEELGR